MSTLIFNKKIIPANKACIRHNDRGFSLGHGLFETILIKRNTIPALDYHWNRLVTSAPILGIAIPFSREELEAMLFDLISQNKLKDKLAGARITLTQGESERGLLPLQTPKPNFLISVFERALCEKPYSALIVRTRKNEQSPAARVKSLSYLDNILAQQEARQQGYDEAILLNSAAHIADGAASNVFMVKDSVIRTPPLSDGALPGVVRALLFEEGGAKFPILEQSIHPTELELADEIFLTNALMGIKSVHKLNNKNIHSFSIASKLCRLLRDNKGYL